MMMMMMVQRRAKRDRNAAKKGGIYAFLSAGCEDLECIDHHGRLEAWDMLVRASASCALSPLAYMRVREDGHLGEAVWREVLELAAAVQSLLNRFIGTVQTGHDGLSQIAPYGTWIKSSPSYNRRYCLGIAVPFLVPERVVGVSAWVSFCCTVLLWFAWRRQRRLGGGAGSRRMTSPGSLSWANSHKPSCPLARYWMDLRGAHRCANAKRHGKFVSNLVF